MNMIALSTCGKSIDEKLFSDCAKCGIGALEISPSQGRFGEVDYAQISRLSKKYGVKLWSMHLPFYPFEIHDISALDGGARKSAVDAAADVIAKGSAIGIDKFVIHPSGEPIDGGERSERLLRAKDSLAFLAAVAAGYGAVLCVEDLPRTCLGNCSGEMIELLSADSRLRSCFDTNHLLGEDPVGYVKAVGGRIVTTHISDYDFLNERHWLPGEGKLDWRALYGTLKDIGYGGPWLYEVQFEAPSSIKRPRPLVCEDFAENARIIFGGGVPEPLGVPVEGLKAWK